MGDYKIQKLSKKMCFLSIRKGRGVYLNREYGCEMLKKFIKCMSFTKTYFNHLSQLLKHLFIAITRPFYNSVKV